MVHMEGNNEGYVFAVLKEPGRDEYYVYGMVLNGDCKVERSHYMRLNLANSDKITKFAFHPFYRLLFYATEQGDIYQFNMNTPDEKAKKILSFPNEHISVLKFNLLVPYIQDKGRNCFGSTENVRIPGSYICSEVENGIYGFRKNSGCCISV